MALLTTIETSRNRNGPDGPTSPLPKLENKRHHELKRLACSINYDLKGGQSSRGKGKGPYCFLMKPKILAYNVRGLNESNKRLRVRNLRKEWKADMVCLQETKLELASRGIVRNLWDCHHVDWCFFGFKRNFWRDVVNVG